MIINRKVDHRGEQSMALDDVARRSPGDQAEAIESDGKQMQTSPAALQQDRLLISRHRRSDPLGQVHRHDHPCRKSQSSIHMHAAALLA